MGTTLDKPLNYVTSTRILTCTGLRFTLIYTPIPSPLARSLHLTREGELFEDPERYRRLVGKLNYLTVTRLDIAYYVSVVSQYMSSQTVDHRTAVEQILCYLK